MNKLKQLYVTKDEAKELFIEHGSSAIDLRVLKISFSCTKNSANFYWVEFINNEPKLNLALNVLKENGKTNDFYLHFDQKHCVEMKRTEKVIDRLYYLKKANDLKELKVANEIEAMNVLASDDVYLAIVKNGEYPFIAWISRQLVDEKYNTVSLWGYKQKMVAPKAIEELDLNRKIYGGAFIIKEDQNILYLHTQ